MIIEGKITCIRNYKDKYVLKTMDITSADCKNNEYICRRKPNQEQIYLLITKPIIKILK